MEELNAMIEAYQHIAETRPTETEFLKNLLSFIFEEWEHLFEEVYGYKEDPANARK